MHDQVSTIFRSRRQMAALVAIIGFGLGLSSSPSSAQGDGASADAKPTGAPACEVVVLNFEAKGLPKSESHVADILTNTFAAEVAETAGCKVITQSDIQSMTEFDAQRALCGSQESCMAEIGNALGVDIVIGGVVGRLGDAYTLQVMKRNVTKGVVEARVDDTITNGAAGLQVAARNAAKKVYGFDVDTTSQSKTANKSGATGGGESADEGSGGGGLLFAGIGVAGAGALVLAAGATTAFAVDYLVLGDKNAPGADKDLATIVGIGALAGGVVVGIVALGGGGALAALGAMSE